MSSFIRNIQRAAKRHKHFEGRGNRLGVSNPQDKCLIARKKREAR